jgi:predicted metalloprotease with PDZ domain
LTMDEELKVMERLTVDDDYKKQLEIAEHELIAAYTLENLTEIRRGRFERYFFDSEENQEKLRFAETVYAYYQYVEWAETAGSAEARWFDRLRRWLAEPISDRREFRTSSELIESPHRYW